MSLGSSLPDCKIEQCGHQREHWSVQVAKSIQIAMGLHDKDVAFFLAADEPATYLQVQVTASHTPFNDSDLPSSSIAASFCILPLCLVAVSHLITACFSCLPPRRSLETELCICMFVTFVVAQTQGLEMPDCRAL